MATDSKAVMAAAYIKAAEAALEHKREIALRDARAWMAVNAPGTEWANRVRQQLNEALEFSETV